MENDLNQDIAYAQAQSSASEEYTQNDQPPAIQYVTPQQYDSKGKFHARTIAYLA